jgi:8-amino-7-oxononanoate synthase
VSQYLRNKLRGSGVDVADSPAPIVAFRLGDRANMVAVQERLFADGIYVLVSNYIGAGPDGIIRCAIFADHTEADLDALVDGFRC